MSRVPGILFAAALLTLVLVACAPASIGASARHPAELGRGVIEVAPGETLYVLSINTLAELGFNDGDLEGVLFVNETAGRQSARADGRMGLSHIRVPAWWEVSLHTARFVQVQTGSNNRTTVQSVIRVDVPTGASLGQTDLRVSLEGRRGSIVLNIPLRVRQY